MSYEPNAKRYDAAAFRRCGKIRACAAANLAWTCGRILVAWTHSRQAVPSSAAHSISGVSRTSTWRITMGRRTDQQRRTLAKSCGRISANFAMNSLFLPKAGWDMWPGPYGVGGSRKYLLASLDESLSRMGLEYVDIFYSHRPTMDVPLEETMGALAHAVRQGKALYVGISSYSPERTREAAKILKSEGVPLLIHQPSYSMLNRWIEQGLLSTLEELGVGCIAFSPLAQGLLTKKYLNGVPETSRGKGGGIFPERILEQRKPGTRACIE